MSGHDEKDLKETAKVDRTFCAGDNSHARCASYSEHKLDNGTHCAKDIHVNGTVNDCTARS